MSSREKRSSTKKLYPEGILGKKLGMTQIFLDDGRALPVTVIETGPCYVLDLRTEEKHGYSGVKLGFIPKKQQRVNRPDWGQFAKAGKGAFYHVCEVRCDVDAMGLKLGQELKVSDIFSAGELVDVVGISKGRGFAGVFKRYGVSGQPATRGTHENRRHIGAIGCRKFPGRVIKNQKMPGHYGNRRVTVQNLKVASLMPEDNLMLVLGGIPGSKGGLVVVKKAVKSYTAPVALKSGPQDEKVDEKEKAQEAA